MNLKLVIAIFFIVFGVLVSFLPVAIYYFSKYTHFTHNSVEKGSQFIYFVDYTLSNDVKVGYLGYHQACINMSVNVTVLGDRKVLIQVSFPQSYLNSTSKLVPQEYMKYFKPYSEVVNMSSLAAQYFIINKTDGKPIQTIPSPILGEEYYLTYSPFNGTYGYYVVAASGNYSYLFETFTKDYDFTFLKAIDPLLVEGYNASTGISYLIMELNYTNTAPKEDWSYYLLLSFALAFPFNLILIIAGLVVFIMYWRKR